MDGQLLAHCGTERVTREQLALLPVPEATRTHKPVPHMEVVNALIETLGFRNLTVVREEYAADSDGKRCFGVLEINHEFNGCRFAIGLRNSNDKSLRLGLTVGYRVFVCDNLSFKGDFTPVLAKHSASLNLIDVISIGVDRIQRGFQPLKDTVEAWQTREISIMQAKTILYEAFVEGRLKVPMRLIKDTHKAYFEPTEGEFKSRTFWSLSNAFTEAFKLLKPEQFYQATARLGGYLGNRFQELPPF